MILNLVDKKASYIDYNIIKFPDGQQDIVIKGIPKPMLRNEDMLYDDKYILYFSDKPVTIYSRFNNFLDLELIICTVKALRRLKVTKIRLYIPYLLGSRSDRQFKEGGTSYLVDVIAPIINSLDLDLITTVDVHSDVAAACIKNLQVIDNISLCEWALNNIYGDTEKEKSLYLNRDYVLISPDSGSLKKIYKVANKLKSKNNVITCTKYRDEEGNLTKTYVPLNASYLNKDFIIIDDICDGGSTFINIAKEIKKWDTTNECNIYLIVTHSILSKGTDELSKYFTKIYCSNSYSEVENDLIKQLKIT